MFDLFFGRSIPGGGTVSADDWDRFLDDTVTPNLPAGYTVLDGTGAWRNPMTGQTGREPSIVILGVLPDTPDSLAAVNRVRAAYQRRFHQQLVGMASVPVCGAF
ncbi:DUF3574 domain-containing protein [Rhodopila sp.]|uniref:DUF3574 domain-containing protein n=1 Tax=Rhodopila sp. TaxID=2480087 RepID=UPI002C9D52A4|nr:DUF3574 domain-containing protein [Rhodopila sp.]HVZ08978.1 DUF3574 domain-containing protein [Rhodopila sp.]